MAVALWESSLVDAVQTTLSSAITSGATSIPLTSTATLLAPGIVVVDRIDSTDSETPTKREYISFTGISVNDLTGVTHGVAGSTSQSHGSGAIVEGVWTSTHWTDLLDFVQVEHNASGIHTLSTATIAYTETVRLAVTSIASIARIETPMIVVASVASLALVAAASLSYPMPTLISWGWAGALPTVLTGNATHFPMIRASRNWTLSNTFISLLSAPSLGTLAVDINYYSTPTASATSIFTTKPTIDVGEYTTATAATAPVLDLTSLASGTFLRPEIETPNGAGEVMISLIAEERG